MQLYQCDKCKKQTTDPLMVCIMFDRSPEEVTELMAANNFPATEEAREKMKDGSVVTKDLDLCRDCYDKLKSEWLS